MIDTYKLISSFLGIGYLKGGGTIAALVCCIGLYFLGTEGRSASWLPIVSIIVTLLGIYCAWKVEPFWGKDSSRVVIDEVAGMCVSLLFIPFLIKYIVAAFILFRFFDIVKPLLIQRLEKWPGGWGVMADDLLAGIYSNLLMQVIIIYNLF